MGVPWFIHRDDIAQRWGIPPWEVDEVDHREIKLVFKRAAIEEKVRKEFRKRNRRTRKRPQSED